MSIAIDARMIEMSGIGTYIQNLIISDIYDVAIGDEKLIHKYNPRIKVISFDAKIYSLKEQLFFPFKKLKKYNVSLIHFPHYNAPIFCKIPFVSTIHDLTHLIFPNFMKNKLARIYSKILIKHSVKKSRHIITVSENSKKDIIDFFKVDKDKITVTYNAIDSDFHYSNSDLSYLFEKYKIDSQKFIYLYVGNLKEHKNLSRLLKAYSQTKYLDKTVLILAGKAFESLDLKSYESKLNISSNVTHTGLISKGELVDLYNLANVFVFPSLYEGFGIPPIEAMACNTPVISSNTSSLPEILGDAALYFDPYSIEQITNALNNIYENEKLRLDLVQKGRNQIKRYDWRKTVEQTRKILNQ